jgi:hypothetical protein
MDSFLLRVCLRVLGAFAVGLELLLHMHKKSSRRKKKSEDSYTKEFFCAFCAFSWLFSGQMGHRVQGGGRVHPPYIGLGVPGGLAVQLFLLRMHKKSLQAEKKGADCGTDCADYTDFILNPCLERFAAVCSGRAICRPLSVSPLPEYGEREEGF